MAIDSKQISSSNDALARVLFAPVDGTDGPVHPLYANTYGSLHVLNSATLVPEQYDEVYLGYTGANLTSVNYAYNSTTIATLTLTYDGSDNLTKVVKT